MELSHQTITLQEFIKTWLHRTNFDLGRVERMARQAIECVPQAELNIVVGETCLHITIPSMAIYFGLAEPLPLPSESAPEVVLPPPNEVESSAEGEDEAPVPDEPIGFSETPPESLVEKRKPGRPKKS